jgi:hypothetical protein
MKEAISVKVVQTGYGGVGHGVVHVGVAHDGVGEDLYHQSLCTIFRVA